MLVIKEFYASYVYSSPNSCGDIHEGFDLLALCAYYV